jgi:GNAT superfamily N-acetyltransferase
MIDFIPVTDEEEIATVSALADEIWREHYPDIISNEQIVYMLECFQSKSAIRKQIDDGYHYALILIEGKPAGYLAVQADPGEKSLFISKIYLCQGMRGKGGGHAASEYITRLARENGCSRIWLTVNRMNRIAIKAYQRWGFTVTGEVVADIGEGFVMDDYRMEKQLPQDLSAPD